MLEHIGINKVEIPNSLYYGNLADLLSNAHRTERGQIYDEVNQAADAILGLSGSNVLTRADDSFGPDTGQVSVKLPDGTVAHFDVKDLTRPAATATLATANGINGAILSDGTTIANGSTLAKKTLPISYSGDKPAVSALTTSQLNEIRNDLINYLGLMPNEDGSKVAKATNSAGQVIGLKLTYSDNSSQIVPSSIVESALINN